MAALEDNINWPCKVRFSSRVRRAKISVDPLGHVELVLPQKDNFTATEQEKLLQSMLPWLQKTIDKLLPRIEQKSKVDELLLEYNESFSEEILPKYIYLPVLNERWTLHLYSFSNNYIEIKELSLPKKEYLPQVMQGHLGLYAQGAKIQQCCYLLQKWLINRAKPVLVDLTKKLAKSMNLSVAKISVKAQKGRWGSCTSSGNIALNARLILLDTYLIKHVILHELCHRIHMNHSAEFKALLESVSPQSLQKDKELDNALKNLPAWATMRCV